MICDRCCFLVLHGIVATCPAVDGCPPSGLVDETQGGAPCNVICSFSSALPSIIEAAGIPLQFGWDMYEKAIQAGSGSPRWEVNS